MSLCIIAVLRYAEVRVENKNQGQKLSLLLCTAAQNETGVLFIPKAASAEAPNFDSVFFPLLFSHFFFFIQRC